MQCDQMPWPTANQKVSVEWKDNVHIFHLVPRDLKSADLLGQSGLLKIIARFGRWQKMSDTSLSSSLSLTVRTQELKRG